MNSLVVFATLLAAAVAAPQAYKAPFKAYNAFPYAGAAYPGAAYAGAPAAYPYSRAAYPYAPAAYPYPGAHAAYAAAPAVVKPYAAAPYYASQPHSQYVKPVAIVRQAQDDNFDGSFTYDFEAENGITSQASGFVKNAGTPDETQVIQGSYTYISPEGVPITARYIADENGFQIEGDHIPKAPADPYRSL